MLLITKKPRGVQPVVIDPQRGGLVAVTRVHSYETSRSGVHAHCKVSAWEWCASNASWLGFQLPGKCAMSKLVQKQRTLIHKACLPLPL